MRNKGCRDRLTITDPEICRLYWELAEPHGNADQIARRILREHLIAMDKLKPKRNNE